MGSQQLVANPAYVNSKFVATGLTSSGYLWTSEISILPKTSTHFFLSKNTYTFISTVLNSCVWTGFLFTVFAVFVLIKFNFLSLGQLHPPVCSWFKKNLDHLHSCVNHHRNLANPLNHIFSRLIRDVIKKTRISYGQADRKG